MAKKMVFTLTGDLPDDDMDAAEMIGKLKPHRDTFLKAVTEVGMKHTHDTKLMTVKAPSTKKKAATAVADATRREA